MMLHPTKVTIMILAYALCCKNQRHEIVIKTLLLFAAILHVGCVHQSISEIDDSNVLPPATTVDLDILQRADAILTDASVWNRHDTRDCAKSDTTWSLYCALFRASMETTGKYNHRSAAMQETRKTVEELTPGKEFAHRLRDYNNLPTTSFADIKQVLTLTIGKIKNKIWSQK